VRAKQVLACHHRWQAERLPAPHEFHLARITIPTDFRKSFPRFSQSRRMAR
jgi:hypothetical protein